MRWIAWILLPVALIVLNGEIQARGGWQTAISTGAWTPALVGLIASMIAIVPLGLVLLTSVAFAVGGLRLAKHNVLIQELAAVEGLARVDVLCMDKTGTLTEGGLVFDAVHPLAPQPGWEQALAWFGAEPEANATARCLGTAFEDDGRTSTRPDRAVLLRPEVERSQLQRERPRCAHLDSRSTGNDACAGRRVAARLKPSISAPDGVVPRQSDVLRQAGEMAASGLRILLLAGADQLPANGKVEQLPGSLHPVALLTFREQPRSDARETLKFFRTEGVGLKIISGDDPRTVAAIARRVGLEVTEGFDARSLPEDPLHLEEVMESNMVFGRVTPAQRGRWSRRSSAGDILWP